MASDEAERIGELLIDEGIVTQEELARALSESGRTESVLSALFTAGRLPLRQGLAGFLGERATIPILDDLRKLEIDSAAIRCVPEELARKHQLVPIAKIGSILCVAKPNYFNRAAVQELRRLTHLKVKVLQAEEGQVKAAIDRFYNGSGEIPAPQGSAAEALREGVPLISVASEPSVELLPGSTSVFTAVRVPISEFQAEERAVPVRLYREWEDLFVSGRPSVPIKIG